MDQEQRLRMEALQADIDLTRAQDQRGSWRPRAVMITATALILLLCVFGGVLGYQLAQLR